MLLSSVARRDWQARRIVAKSPLFAWTEVLASEAVRPMTGAKSVLDAVRLESSDCTRHG